MNVRRPSLHRLANARGDALELLDYGARIRSLTLAQPGGHRNIVLGYARLGDYLSDRFFMGAVIGRYANRIGNARFTIGHREVQLEANEGPHQLHGGPGGFHTRFWALVAGDYQSATYRLESPDGDQGFPGRVTATVRYVLGDTGELVVRFRAETDAPTPVNLTQHAYFNLDGCAPTGASATSPQPAGPVTIREHRLRIGSAGMTETDAAMIPTGRMERVAGTVFDLRQGRRIGEIIDADDPRIRAQRGVDVNYVLDGAPAATLTSGRGDLEMTVETTAPGLQVYTGQHLAAPFTPCAALCLEPQGFPDAPNQPAFPTTLLCPGDVYDQTLTLRFRR